MHLFELKSQSKTWGYKHIPIKNQRKVLQKSLQAKLFCIAHLPLLSQSMQLTNLLGSFVERLIVIMQPTITENYYLASTESCGEGKSENRNTLITFITLHVVGPWLVSSFHGVFYSVSYCSQSIDVALKGILCSSAFLISFCIGLLAFPI